jgi:hypothetical protein
MLVCEAVTLQRLLYSCFFRGRCLATGLHATMLSVMEICSRQKSRLHCQPKHRHISHSRLRAGPEINTIALHWRGGGLYTERPRLQTRFEHTQLFGGQSVTTTTAVWGGRNEGTCATHRPLYRVNGKENLLACRLPIRFEIPPEYFKWMTSDEVFSPLPTSDQCLTFEV